jgi:hypothetical protein
MQSSLGTIVAGRSLDAAGHRCPEKSVFLASATAQNGTPSWFKS